MYEPGIQPPLKILMKNLAIWLGKYTGMTYIHTAHLEVYAMHALTKTAHSNASHIRKHLHETAKSRDHLDCKRMWLKALKQLNEELSV